MLVSTARFTRRSSVAAFVAIAMLIPACSSSNSDKSSGSPSSDSSQDPFGTAKQATGSAVTLGFLSEGKGPSVDTTPEIRGAQAAAQYANAYLGGINGHPITVKACEAQNVPAKATDCAQQMVSANVPAVVEGSFGEVDNSIDVLTPAGIPLAVHGGSTSKALSTPGVFVFSNALSYFGTGVADAAKQGVKKLSVLVIDVPAASGPVKALFPLVSANAGIAVKVTTIAPGTADMTPQVTAANGDSPDAFVMFGDPTFCQSALKAIKTVAPKAKVYGIDRCISSSGASSIPGGFEGVRVVASTDLDTARPDGKIFAAAMSKWGQGADVEAASAVGYAAMLGLVRILNAAKVTDLTPANISAAIKAMSPLEYPLSGGSMFQCNGKQVALGPNICSSDGIIATADKDGNLKTYERVPADPKIYAPPAK
ncbi:MAG: hypothetical protein JWM76_2072 [Pseudonocardiales bacterium]|nr:hypothetical protein [Pseudonocardiales bacterium]